jgi:hypothetical protein
MSKMNTIKRSMRTVIDTLQIQLAQQSFDLAVLALWEHATEYLDLTPESIRAFTFRPEHLTGEEQKANRSASYASKPPVYCDKNWHNCVRLIDDRLFAIPGIARPIPPEWTPTQLQVRL